MLTTKEIITRKKERSVKPKVWQAALYVRLSREDGDKEESDSIVNQKSLLTHFADMEEDISVYDTYVDDGYSGTNFERPDFMRMMQDIKERRVNCVIVKDLSRFGRNYIDVGNYMEKVFPLMDIRFVSVTDSIDNVKNPQTMNNIIVPFKNLINDEYCRDISNKVRSSLDMKRKQGKHIGSFACYGYLKDPEDHNHLIIDPVTAPIVKEIYQWFLSGMSMLGITKKLNEMGIPSPSAYKKQQGLNYKNRHEKILDGKWIDSAVRRVLTNAMYTGSMVQGVQKTKSYKVQVSQRQPRENWIVVEDTHEPIVSREEFGLVQELVERNKRTAPMKQEVYLFSGFVRCGDCGRAMARKQNSHSYGEYTYYVCSTYTKRDKHACTRHSIRADRLEKLVLQSIQMQVALAVDMDMAIAEIQEKMNRNTDKDVLLNALQIQRKKEQEITDMVLELYPDMKSGLISREEFVSLKSKFDSQKKEIQEKINSLEQKLKNLEQGQQDKNEFLESFMKYRNIKSLTREIIVELIDMIYVFEDGKIKLVFKYQDPFREAEEYIEKNKALAVS